MAYANHLYHDVLFSLSELAKLNATPPLMVRLSDDERASRAEQAKATVVKHAWCQMCGPAKTACSKLCYVKGGRWVHVEGNPLAGNNGMAGSRTLCPKGNAAMQYMYDPLRLMYPLKRVGKKGEGRFVRCTWDEAMAAIGEKLRETKRLYGPESYAVLSPQAFRVLWAHGRRFLNVHGSPNYLHSGICALQRKASKQITIGKAATEPKQLDKTKLFVNWGENKENSGINQGQPQKYLKSHKGDLKIIDIRPMMDQLTAKADIWVPVRPGTDCALALAFLHVIIGEDLYDHEFCDTWCNGFDKLAEHVKQYTPEWAERVTGVPASQIVEVARMMGTIKPMGIATGNGVGDQQSDGNAAAMAMSIIVAITGNLAIPGGGGAPGPSYPPLVKPKPYDILTSRLQANEDDIANGWFAGMSKLVAPETPRWFQNPGTWESGPNSAYYRALMSVLTEKPYPIRFLLGQASNPLNATRHPVKVAEALEKLEFYVVVDVYRHAACAYADYVLPACTHYETSHQFAVKNSPRGTFVGINQEVMPPLAQSKSDWQFYLDMAVAAGYGDDFWNGDMDACLHEQLDGSGVTLEQLRTEPQGVFIPRDPDAAPKEPVYRNYEKLFAELPNGKVQCYNEYIGGKVDNTDEGVLDYLPVYRGAPESFDTTPELAEEYPLVFSDVHAYRLCCHSYYMSVPYLRELEPYPWARINPATARKYGIEDGDWMRVESRNGWAVFKAEYFEGIAPDVIMSKRGWGQSCGAFDLPEYDCFNGGSDTNVLYSGDESMFDHFHSGMSKQTLVRISKLEEGGAR